ncbi:MAG: DUF2809 domain-containing protein [Eubacteriales bacterium]|nr:DUF2809 domain-containing protein [Eubacteriales bacterium]
MAKKGRKLTLVYILACLVCLFGALYFARVGGWCYYVNRVLWAMSWYFLIVLFTQKSRRSAFVTALIICLGLEATQLITGISWVEAIRANAVGNWFFGGSFLWSDIVIYACALLGAWAFDLFVIRK